MQNEVVAQRGWDKFLVSTDTGLVLVDTESWEVSDAIDGDALEAILESGDWVPFTGQERVEQAINEALGVPSHELTDAVRALSLSLFNAGASQHKGLLFSLWLNDEQARQLAIRGGEPPEKMHVTLCYCGNVATLGDVTIANALVAAAKVASQQKPFTSTITGKGRFDATEFSDWMDVVYAEMECPTIQSFRAHLAAALTNAGATPRGDFEYHPHITLMYVPPGVDDVIDPPKLTFEFRGLTVSIGGELKTTFPFGEHVNLAAIGPDGKGPYGKDSTDDRTEMKARKAVDAAIQSKMDQSKTFTSQRVDLPVVEDVRHTEMIGAGKKKPKKRKTVTWRGVKLSRVPTAFEEAVISLHAIPERLALENDKTVAAILDIRRHALAARIAGKDVSDPSAYSAAGVLVQAQMRVACYGASEVRQELHRQGATIQLAQDHTDVFDPIGVAVMTNPLLKQSAALCSERLHKAWQAEIESVAIRLRRVRRTVTLHAQWQELAEPRALNGLKSAVRAIVNEAFAAGRSVEMKRLHADSATISLKTKKIDDQTAEDLVDHVIQTAVMDTNTCEPCADIDGDVYEYDSDEQIENEPPYYKCLGGDLCRCLQVYVLKGGGSWAVRGDRIVEED